MARRSTQPAVGNRADTGTPVSLPPRKNAAPDLVSRIRAPQGGEGYGQNSSAMNPSSVAPGTELSSAMAKVLREAQDDGQDVLGMIIAGKAHTKDGSNNGIPDLDSEERTVSAEQYPARTGMARQQEPNSTKWASLPETLGASADDSAARRAAELKAGGNG